MYTLDWFKNSFVQNLDKYVTEYRFFEEGDFGSLNQVIFNSTKMGGEVEFWSSGFMRIHLWDYENDKELINILLEPSENKEKESVFTKLAELLK